MTDLTAAADKLRDKFPVERIGKKPKITCKACGNSPSRVCGDHKKSTCKPLPEGCGQWITERHMHVEFVGHANVTDRLLEVDPAWTWEPMAFGPDGLPALDANGGLWIRLTVAGVTRIGYGGADGKRGEDAVKEAIGDAIKIAAMRFGVGLDLWRKEEASGKPSTSPEPAPSEPNPAMLVAQARARVAAACTENGWDRHLVAALWEKQAGHPLGEATDAVRVGRFRDHLYSLPDADLKAPAANGVPQ